MAKCQDRNWSIILMTGTSERNLRNTYISTYVEFIYPLAIEKPEWNKPVTRRQILAVFPPVETLSCPQNLDTVCLNCQGWLMWPVWCPTAGTGWPLSRPPPRPSPSRGSQIWASHVRSFRLPEISPSFCWTKKMSLRLWGCQIAETHSCLFLYSIDSTQYEKC